MKGTFKKFIAVLSAVALLAAGMTGYQTSVSAAALEWTELFIDSSCSGTIEDTSTEDYLGATVTGYSTAYTWGSDSKWQGQMRKEGISVSNDEEYTLEFDVEVSVDKGLWVQTLTNGKYTEKEFDIKASDGLTHVSMPFTTTGTSLQIDIAFGALSTSDAVSNLDMAVSNVAIVDAGEAETTTHASSQSGSIVGGMSWQGWFEAEGWSNYIISTDSTGYTLTDKGIGTNWYSIQTGIDEVDFLSGIDYTCAFTFTTSAPKSFTVDNRLTDGVIFTPREVTASDTGWVDNGNGTYSYDYVGTYSSASNAFLDVRISLGYHGTDTNFSSNGTITATVSDFIIEKTSEYNDGGDEESSDEETTGETPVESTTEEITEETTNETTGETTDQSTTAGSSAGSDDDYDWTLIGDGSNLGDFSNQYYYTIISGSGFYVDNIQSPSQTEGHAAIYIGSTSAGAVQKVVINGTDVTDNHTYDEVEGGSLWINLDALTLHINTIEITYATATATILIRNDNVSEGTSPSESTSDDVTTEGDAGEDTSVETTAAGSSTGSDDDYDWTLIGDGSNLGDFSNQYYYTIVSGSGFYVDNIQSPSQTEGHAAIYIGSTGAGAVQKVIINGTDVTDNHTYDEVEGGSLWINLDALTLHINTIEITYSTATATILIKNDNVTDETTGADESTDESTSADESTSDETTTEETTLQETTTQAPTVTAPMAPTGLVYAGNDELPIYFAWAAVADADYYNIYVDGALIATSMAADFDGTGYEEYFPEGTTVVFGVSAVNDGGESEIATIEWAVPEKEIETTTEETSDETTEETTDETSEEITEETTDETSEEITEETTDETSEEITEETTGETTGETTDESTTSGSSQDDDDYDWTLIGDGSNLGDFSNQYYYTIISGSGFYVDNIQSPAQTEGHAAIYIGAESAGAVQKVVINGTDVTDNHTYDEVEGGSLWINLDALTLHINTIEITYATTTATILIRNDNVSDDTTGSDESTGESTSVDESTSDEVSSEVTTTASSSANAPAAPVGLVYAGNDDYPIYFAWAAVADADYYNIYVDGVLIAISMAADFDGTGYEEYFPEGTTVTFGVTAVNESGESEMTTITWNVPGESKSEEDSSEETSDDTTTELVTTSEDITEESTSEDVTTSSGDDYEWSAIADGSDLGDFADQYYYTIVSGEGIYVDNIQSPAQTEGHAAIYIGSNGAGAVEKVVINGVDVTDNHTYDEVEGGSLWINLDALTQHTNTIEITYTNGEVTILIRNDNVIEETTSSDETTTIQPETETPTADEEQTTTSDETTGSIGETTEAPYDESTGAGTEKSTSEQSANVSGGSDVNSADSTGSVTKASEETTLKKTVIKKVKAKKKSAKKIKIKVKKVAGADGYQIRVYKNKKKAKKNKKAILKKKSKTRKFTLKSKKLKNKSKLFIRVRAFATTADNTKVYGAWSKVKKVKIKK